jgi:hypothetical protein
MPPIDAGQRKRAGGVGHHDGLIIQGAFDAIQGHQVFLPGRRRG